MDNCNTLDYLRKKCLMWRCKLFFSSVLATSLWFGLTLTLRFALSLQIKVFCLIYNLKYHWLDCYIGIMVQQHILMMILVLCTCMHQLICSFSLLLYC